MGGGILPVALKNNKLYFLFGLENELDDTPGWADFGGGHEKHESMFDTAAREGCEELNGFLGCENDIKLQMIQNKILHLKYKTYTSHLFKIDYDDNLPLYYNNNYEFFIKYLPKVKNAPHNGLLEKMQIKWFSMDDIKREAHFRPFFNNIIKKLIDNEDIIMKNVNQLTKSTQHNGKDKDSNSNNKSVKKNKKQTKKMTTTGKRMHNKKHDRKTQKR